MAKNDREFTKIQELAYELRVEQAMTTDVIQIGTNNTINELRNIMRDHKISGAPVVENGMVVGIISIEDLLKCLMSGETESKIEEKMTRNIEYVYPDEPLTHAISKFDKLGYGRFPVLDRFTGVLVGMITKGDILKCLLKKLEVDYHEEEIHRYRASHIFEDINADGVILTFRFNIEGGNFRRAGECSSKLKNNLLRLGIHPVTVRRIGIATYEAEMNIVIYTPGGQITTYVDHDKIMVDAVDTGPGIADIDKAMQPGYSTAPDWVRELGFGAGMGLPNIKKCSDEMRIDSRVGEGTKLQFTVFMNRQ